MYARIASFSCGVILLYYSGVIPPSSAWLPAALTGAMVVLLYGVRARSGSLQIVALLLVGFTWAVWHAAERLSVSLPIAAEGEEQVVVGHLCDIPAPGSYGSVRFSLCVHQWQSGTALAPGRDLPRRLRLSWYGDDAMLDLPALMRVTVRLKRPHGAVNPAGFRYESWLFRNNYRATGTVRELQPWLAGDCKLTCAFHSLRRNLAAKLSSGLEGNEHHPLVQALLLGNRGHMTPDHWRVLQATGTIHLVAISGLHIGLIAIGLGLMVRVLLAGLPQHRLAPSRRRALAFAVVVTGSLLYALAAGFTVPTQRAWLMVVMASWLLFRAGRLASGASWLVALGLVLLIDPFAPLDRGFWLSFSAVAMLLLAFSGRLRAPSALTALVMAQSVIFAGLWPMLSVMDQAPATLGWLANLVAIPWLSLVVMPVLVLGALLLALWPSPTLVGMVSQGFDGVLTVLWWWLSLLADWTVPGLSAGLAGAIVAALLVLSLVLVPNRRARLAGVVLLTVWLAPQLLYEEPEGADNVVVPRPELWVFDVGQGLAVMLRHEDKVLLYDTGPETASGYSAAASVLVPSLQKLGVARINTLIISHGDRDHAGGLVPLFDALAVEAVVSGEPKRLQERYPDLVLPNLQHCRPDSVGSLGDVSVTLWQDEVARPTAARPDSNDTSCVAVLGYDDTDVILPGDISSSVEQRFIASGLIAPVAHRILVASHHGSNTSSGTAWVRALQPDAVVYTAGYQHRYGHPHPDVRARFAGAGAAAFNTAYAGALRWRLGGEVPLLSRWRADAPFWIRRPESHWLAVDEPPSD
ncbi:MAG: DNA internalization-related competence protein ComEC/Rec2 [Oleiphilaceae bacterium]|nr:DNA internalization-related competence protein ComEC/Rec2 [Oleiphilaceae bacterium]